MEYVIYYIFYVADTFLKTFWIIHHWFTLMSLFYTDSSKIVYIFVLFLNIMYLYYIVLYMWFFMYIIK